MAMKARSTRQSTGSSPSVSPQLASSASTRGFHRVCREKQRYQRKLQKQLAIVERRLSSKQLRDHLVLSNEKTPATIAAPLPTGDSQQLTPAQELQLRTLNKLRQRLACAQEDDLADPVAGNPLAVVPQAVEQVPTAGVTPIARSLS
jgi:hypothetical protein